MVHEFLISRNLKRFFIKGLEMYTLDYSRVSNKRRVWNNRIGWTFASRKINVWYGIIVLGGKNPKINNRVGWKNNIVWKFPL